MILNSVHKILLITNKKKKFHGYKIHTSLNRVTIHKYYIPEAAEKWKFQVVNNIYDRIYRPSLLIIYVTKSA